MLEVLTFAITCGVCELAYTEECDECETKGCIERCSGLVFLADVTEYL